MGLTNLEAEGDKPLSSKFSVWEPHQVTDPPLGGMEKVMIEGRGIPVDLLERKKKKEQNGIWNPLGKWGKAAGGFSQLDIMGHYFYFIHSQGLNSWVGGGREGVKTHLLLELGREIIAGLSLGRSYSPL